MIAFVRSAVHEKTALACHLSKCYICKVKDAGVSLVAVGGKGNRVHRAQRSGGPAVAWPSEAPGCSIRVVGWARCIREPRVKTERDQSPAQRHDLYKQHKSLDPFRCDSRVIYENTRFCRDVGWKHPRQWAILENANRRQFSTIVTLLVAYVLDEMYLL